MIPRNIYGTILQLINTGTMAWVSGSSAVGKTSLLSSIVQSFPREKCLVWQGKNQDIQNLLTNFSPTVFNRITQGYHLIAIDDIEAIPQAEHLLKYLADHCLEPRIVLTSNTALSEAEDYKQALGGRVQEFKLFPLSTEELGAGMSDREKKDLLVDQLLYGGYPFLSNVYSGQEKRRYLASLLEERLFSEITRQHRLKQPEMLRKIATLLSFQTGSEVSLNWLGTHLHLDVKTVNRYLDLLKRHGIIFELRPFSWNTHREVFQSKKYYFYDLGIRNALINNFFPLDTRVDGPVLWENFIATERSKKLAYENSHRECYFWRSYHNAKVDWIEKQREKIEAYQCLWEGKKAHTPRFFKNTYQTEIQPITPQNYLSFIG